VFLSSNILWHVDSYYPDGDDVETYTVAGYSEAFAIAADKCSNPNYAVVYSLDSKKLIVKVLYLLTCVLDLSY
jgi:hypothetical protein